jgi:hypothetical protein
MGIWHVQYSEWAMGCTIWQGQEISLFFKMSRQVLEPTQPPTEGVPGTLIQGINLPGCEADQSLHVWLRKSESIIDLLSCIIAINL